MSSNFTGTPVIGDKITQSVTGGTAKAYIASYDSETKVLKYFRDRSLYFNNNLNQTDYNTVTSESTVYDFQPSGGSIVGPGFNASIDTTFPTGSQITIGNKTINLGTVFTNGLSNPDINKKKGDIIYIDNRPSVTRDIRQKEDIKIILEF